MKVQGDRRWIVTVGLDASPPVPLHNGHPGEGFEVDLLQAIAERTGFGIRYASALWNEIVQRLVDGKLDMICTAATITADRQQIVAFSAPYLEFELAIVVRKEEGRITRATDLTGKSVGVRIATTAEKFVRQSVAPKSLRLYHFNTEAYSALRTGEVDAVVDDHPIARGFESLMPGLRVAASMEGTKSQYGIMFAKGNDKLRKAVDDALDRLRQDGTYDALYRKWFGQRTL